MSNKIRELEERMAKLEKVLVHLAQEITSQLATIANEDEDNHHTEEAEECEDSEECDESEESDHYSEIFTCDHNSRSPEVYICDECNKKMCPECRYYYCEKCEKWNDPRCIYKRRFGWCDPNEPEEFKNHIEDEEHIITFLCSTECIESTGV